MRFWYEQRAPGREPFQKWNSLHFYSVYHESIKDDEKAYNDHWGFETATAPDDEDTLEDVPPPPVAREPFSVPTPKTLCAEVDAAQPEDGDE